MIKSIKYFLIISLLLSITVASAINGIGNYLLDQRVIQPYLDSQLVRASTLIGILNQSAMPTTEAKGEIINYLLRAQPITGQVFLFQIWKSDGLLMRSPNYPSIMLKDVPLGFSDRKIRGNEWRVYSVYDANKHIKVVVAELYNLRRELANDIARSNANALLITYPVFGILIWFIISIALRSISRVTTEISNRASTYLEPVQLTEIPNEIKPLVAELNQLFIRLKLRSE